MSGAGTGRVCSQLAPLANGCRRWHACTPSAATSRRADKVLRLNRLYAQTISGDYYDKNRFPTYCYDKILCGLIDSHQIRGRSRCLRRSSNERRTRRCRTFPKHAVEHDIAWRPNKDKTWTWDESYTISENLFLAYQRGAGKRYRELGRQYLVDAYYDPLAEGRNVLAGRHAYSYVNSLEIGDAGVFDPGQRETFARGTERL